ncbi:hypothetical protein BH24ACT12_BH24ACT12_23180 [soil metagenome]
MIALDASVLVADLYPFDVHHDVATGVLLMPPTSRCSCMRSPWPRSWLAA